MTDDNKEDLELDEEYIPVTRKVEPLGIGWAFREYKGQEDEWKNCGVFHVFRGFEHFQNAYHHKDKRFIRIRTGASSELSQKKDAQDLQKKALDGIGIPVEWEVKGLPVDMAFYEYEIVEKKTSEVEEEPKKKPGKKKKKTSEK